MRQVIVVILANVLFVLLGYSQHYQKDLERIKRQNQYEIEQVDKNTIKLKHKLYGKTKTVRIADQNKSLKKISEEMQMFDLINIPDSLYQHKYEYKSTLPLGSGMGYPMVIGDFNKNEKLDFFGEYKIAHNSELAEMAIAELQEDGSYELQKIYSDSIVLPLAMTDLDNDGLLELNGNYVGTQWPEIHNYECKTDSTYPDTLNFGYKEYQIYGQISSETFTDLDKDGKTDVIHVGDDSLDEPHGYKVCVAEYKKEVNNFVQVFRFPPPNFNIYGFSYGDFDNDGFTEFATGSISGDVYIIENKGDDAYEWIYSDTISSSNAYLTCATNDIDGNGKIEFFTGGSAYYNGIGGTKVYWFEADGDNNYKKVRSFFLNGTDVLGNSALYNYDVNADGKKDLVFSFENVVVILTWDNKENRFELFYKKSIDWPEVIKSVNIYDTYSDGQPDLYINMKNYEQTPKIRSNYYENRFYTNIESEIIGVPVKFHLYQNYPNPFNSTTKIKFTTKTTSLIDLVIYDITGKEVLKLIHKKVYTPGVYNVAWQGINSFGKEVSSGIYLYQLKTKNMSLFRKLILIK